MSERNRATLYNFFADGQRPGGEQFRDLVDSMLNMEDEGFRKTPQHGLHVHAIEGHDALLSFYRHQRPQEPQWALRFSREGDRLQMGSERGGAALTLDAPPAADGGAPQGRVGINQERPVHALHVTGTVCSTGRLGGRELPAQSRPVADGRWHAVTEPLEGCQAFEVMAGAGRERSGQFALMHAVAMNTFNPDGGLGWLDRLRGRKPIRDQHAWYGKRCDRLQLRWAGTGGRGAKYWLELRSRCVYEDPATPIQVQLTQLWFDPLMKGGA
jgi:hypothetical protein